MDNDLLFQKYLSHKLSSSDRKAFEEKLESDLGFKQSFEDHVKMQLSMDILLEDDMRKVFKDLKPAYKPESQVRNKKTRNLNIRRFLPIAASLILLLSAFFMWELNANEPDLFSKHYKYILDETRSGVSSGEATNFELHYQAAHKILNKEQKTKEDYLSAAQIFEELMPQAKGLDYEKVKFNLSLCYINFDSEKTKRILLELKKESQHNYGPKIEQILNDL